MATKSSIARKEAKERAELESRLEAMEKSIASLIAEIEALKAKKPAASKPKTGGKK